MNLLDLWKQLKKEAMPSHWNCDHCYGEVFDNNRLCHICRADLIKNDGTICPKCGRSEPLGQICMECKQTLPSYTLARSPLCYEGTGRFMMLMYKGGRGDLAYFFVEQMKPLLDELPHFDYVTFIPTSPAAMRVRGFNPAQKLALALSKERDVPCLNLLVKKKDKVRQKALNRRERLEHMKNVFLPTQKLKGRSILLVDDVLTTGATVSGASEALIRAGAEYVYVLTALHTKITQR